MNSKITLIIISIILFTSHLAMAQFRVSGIVSDKLTGERLIGASVVELGTTNGTSTDNNGYFSLISKNNTIQVSYIGYQTTIISFPKDSFITIALQSGELLHEVKVLGKKQSVQHNVSTLSKQEIVAIPSLGGKPDVLKALQLLPGIQSQQEGSSLLNVRGGNPGENLYLIDNTPLIYVNHLGGFASVFNPEMINNIEIYKGSFPSKYGGKLSSVVVITQREGDKSALKGSASVGVTDASFCIEGPLLDKKASFLVTGRKTLIDPLMIFLSGISGGGDYYLFYGFHDLNGKFTWQPNEKNRFHFNLYEGDDYLKYWTKNNTYNKEKSTVGTIWGNWLASARWSRIVSPRLFADNSLSFTRYRLKNKSEYKSKTVYDTVDYRNKFLSTVQDLSIRSDWQYKVLKEWSFDFGAKGSYLVHIPNSSYNSKQTTQAAKEVINSFESCLYINNNLSFYNFIDATIGLRLVEYTVGKYNNLSFEPRIHFNTILSENHSLNLSYQKVTQFAHLVFTSGGALNNEVWIPADKTIAPSWSEQYTAGWKGNYFDDKFSTEISVYYKILNQLATYKEGYTSLMGDGGWRTKIETGGTGISKGAEFLLKKNQGNWTGFIGYTYSISTRQFPGINKGKIYNYEYDRPHSLTINASWKINTKWDFNLLWVYQTGIPYTPVIGRQLTPLTNGVYGEELNFEETFIYGERNSERLIDYHRLDIGFTKTTTTKKGRKAQWVYSVYNLYNRQNPASYYYGYDKDGYVHYDPENYVPLKQYQISFFPIMPSVSYKVFFE